MQPSGADQRGTIQLGEDSLRLGSVVTRTLVDHIQPGETVRLVPRPALEKGLRDGSLLYMHSATGDKAIIVERSTRHIAGHPDVVRPGTPIPTEAVMQVLAVVVQQYYLHEINSKLESLALAIEDLRARSQNQGLGKLEALRADLGELRRRRQRGLPAQPEDRQLLRRWTQDANALRHESLSDVQQGLNALEGGPRAARGGTAAKYHDRDEYIGGLEQFEANVLDFEMAIHATILVLACRAERIALAETDADLEHLLSENATDLDRLPKELDDASRRLQDVLAHAELLHELRTNPERFLLDPVTKLPTLVLPWASVLYPAKKAAEYYDKEQRRRRQDTISTYREQVTRPVQIADAIQTALPRAVIASRSATGEITASVDSASHP